MDRKANMSKETLPAIRPTRATWNNGRIIGQKRPLLPKHVWSIRVRLEMADNMRDLALFKMAVDCKLRGYDLVCLKVNDVYAAGRVITVGTSNFTRRGSSPLASFKRMASARAVFSDT